MSCRLGWHNSSLTMHSPSQLARYYCVHNGFFFIVMQYKFPVRLSLFSYYKARVYYSVGTSKLDENMYFVVKTAILLIVYSVG